MTIFPSSAIGRTWILIAASLSFSAIDGVKHVSAKELTVARSVDADSLDPHKTSNTQSLQVTNLIFDTLLTMDSSGGVQPGLASEWTVSSDGTEYSFTIRDGVRCQDGTTFDAVAAKFSLDRAVAPETVNPNKASWGPISGTSVDGKTLSVFLSEPYGPFLSFLSSIQAAVICPSSVDGDSFIPIGTGPFKYVNWVRNDRIDLESYTDHRNFSPLIDNPGSPHVNNLKLVVIPEAVARMAALRSGEVDMAEPSLQEAVDLREDDNFRVYAAQYSGQQILAAFTWRLPPLNDPEVRRAIGMAMNRDAYASIGFEGLVDPAYCPVAPNLYATDAEKCKSWGVKYDPQKAKEILVAKGYGPDNPFNVRLLVHKLPGWDEMHQIMQQDLAAVGVEAEIETREVAAFFDYMSGVNAETEGVPAVWTMGMSGVDPDYLYFLWHRPGFVNMGLNSKVDAMLTEQRALSGAAREAKVHDIHEYLLTEGYAIPLLSPGWGWLMASTSKIKGFKIGYMVSLLFNDVIVE